MKFLEAYSQDSQAGVWATQDQDPGPQDGRVPEGDAQERHLQVSLELIILVQSAFITFMT